MSLSAEQIAKIAAWQPIEPGFGRDNPQTSVRIHHLAKLLTSAKEFGCDLIADDGLAIYFTMFAYLTAHVDPRSPYRRVEGVLAYLSACGPVSVLGRSRRCVGHGFNSYDPFTIDTLLEPDAVNSDLDRNAVEAIRQGGYDVLGKEQGSEPLPHGIRPFEYCLGQEPWDRLFHALFANTD
jgi:hypothetical protein